MKVKSNVTTDDMLDALAETMARISASQNWLEQGRRDYHKAIEFDLERALSLSERELVDVAFNYAFADGWIAHKREAEHDVR